MLDARTQAANEIADHLLNVTFAPPSGWPDARCEEHAMDLRAEMRKLMPSSGNPDELQAWGLGLRLQLKRRMRYQTWPSLRELREAADGLNAVKARSRAENGDSEKVFSEGDEHPGMGYWVRTIEAWIDRFGEWPSWATGEHSKEAARRMIAQGKSRGYLRRLGAEFLDNRTFGPRQHDDSAA